VIVEVAVALAGRSANQCIHVSDPRPRSDLKLREFRADHPVEDRLDTRCRDVARLWKVRRVRSCCCFLEINGERNIEGNVALETCLRYA
jgi:hypothetical protein